MLEVHKILYSKSSPHPGDVFYVLITRAVLGKWIETKSTDDEQPGIFASDGKNSKELDIIPNHTPPTPHHSLRGTKFPRFREFIVFHADQLYPEYLVAYHRR
jgi:hypothetical protein